MARFSTVLLLCSLTGFAFAQEKQDVSKTADEAQTAKTPPIPCRFQLNGLAPARHPRRRSDVAKCPRNLAAIDERKHIPRFARDDAALLGMTRVRSG